MARCGRSVILVAVSRRQACLAATVFGADHRLHSASHVTRTRRAPLDPSWWTSDTKILSVT
eukprot:12207916-Prorocentrum_lima.AAC.1